MSIRKIKISLFACLLTCSIISVPAQTDTFRFGVKAGLNMPTALVDDATNIRFKPGYQAGITVDYLLQGSFMIQSGLLFTAKGSKLDELNGSSYIPNSPDMTHTFNQLYLEIPLYGAYKIRLSDHLGIVVGAGPYMAYGIGGKTKQKLHNAVWGDGTSEAKWDTFGNNDDVLHAEGSLNRFDFGAGIKADLEYYKYVLGIGIASSIINIAHNEEFHDMKYRNFNIDISLGYKF